MSQAAPALVFTGRVEELPLWLARLHRRTPVGEELDLQLAIAPPVAGGVDEVEMFHGAGFDAVERGGATWRLRRLRTLPDWIGPAMTALVVGLNPSPASADGAVAFARPGNRFWPAALEAGLVGLDRDPEQALTGHGVGFTDLVKRTTRTAAELSSDDYRYGMERLERLSAWLQPERLVIVGLAGWRAARDRTATAGWQPGGVGGRPAYLMPNTSGLNAHTTLGGFVDHFRAALQAADGRGAKPD